MVERIQAGHVYVVQFSGHRIPVRAVQPLAERRDWWMAASCRSETPIRLPVVAFESEIECQPASQG